MDLRANGIESLGVSLDVTGPTSVARAAESVDAAFGRVDVLVNNAGVLPEATAPGAVDAVASTFATNAIGAFRVTEAFLPLLRRSTAGRIVNVSSRMGSLAEQADSTSPYYGTIVPGYQAAKAALNSYTISLSKALADTPIVVTSVCPGFVRTDLTPVNREQAPTSPEEAAEIIVAAATAPTGARSGTFVDASGPIRW